MSTFNGQLKCGNGKAERVVANTTLAPIDNCRRRYTLKTFLTSFTASRVVDKLRFAVYVKLTRPNVNGTCVWLVKRTRD